MNDLSDHEDPQPMNTLRFAITPATLITILSLAGCTGGGGPSAPDVDPNAPAAAPEPQPIGT